MALRIVPEFHHGLERGELGRRPVFQLWVLAQGSPGSGWTEAPRPEAADYELDTTTEVSFHGAFQDNISYSVPKRLDLLKLFRIPKGSRVK